MSNTETIIRFNKEFDKWFGHGKKGHLHGLLSEDYYKEVKKYFAEFLSFSLSQGRVGILDILSFCFHLCVHEPHT